ncbi:tRNA lysidine(34) synthetase TilS [Synechococcus sp. M16.1]|uniref:tRNA lysidine(34) synthetase TilS n=1 Tax=Synechococcus sp. M16.1 TaxID=1442553 RepID=UPI00185F7E83|nr:tRNA lysidine(34) synthetase TilS [Synechococcus sp. M16.1]QNJ10235.1 tRNA(Ile)-lysidine synthetase [Synechococcus sp. M16.1]
MGETHLSFLRWTSWHDLLHRRLLMQPQLLPQGSALLLAVSGGQDSMALLALLQDLAPMHGWSLSLWHGDHGWHDRSSRIAAELSSWCQQRQLPLQVDQAAVGQVPSEATARQWRYAQLEQRAREAGADVVTGHTASDRAETMLLQLARGSDMACLAALPSVRRLSPEGPLLRRPLLHLQRRDTLQICQDLALPIWEDPSNQSPEFARNRIRQEVLPVLEALHPGSTQRMSNLAERVSQVRDSQTELSRMALELLKTATGLDRRGLGALSPATRRLLLAQWLQQHGVTALPSSQLDELSRRLESGAPGGAADLAGGWHLSWKGAELVLQQRAAEH